MVNAAGSAINVIINTSLFKYGGDSAVAAAEIFTTYTSLLTTIVVGLCQGMQPIIGYNYGAGRFDRLKRTYWIAVAVATIITTAGGIIGLLCPRYIASAFTIDANLINATVNGLSISLMAFWMVGFQIVSTTFFQSIGKAGKSIFLSLTRQVLFIIPLLLILPTHFNLDGVWASFPTSDVFATIATTIMIWWEFRLISRASTPVEI